jgi:uncharacterized membrane protein YdjX (TVP38/TMEM64 family)
MTNPIGWLRKHARLLAVLVLVVTLLLLAHFSGLRTQLTPDFVRQQLAAHPAGGVALFVLLFVLGNLTQIPGWVFLAAAVLALGGVWGGVVTYVAATTSCVVTFWVVRLVGGDATQALTSPRALRILARLHRYPVQSVVLLRTLFQTLPALNMALALSGIGFQRYLLGTLLGLPLPIAAYCVFFDFLWRLKGG